MNTVINKKGNKGFTASAWNCHQAQCKIDGEFQNTISIALTSKGEVTKKSVKFIVRPVTINSCGKKQMTLIAEDEGESMRGNFFSADTPIYETAEDAEEYIKKTFEECLPVMIRNQRNDAARTRQNSSKYHWCESHAKANERAAEMLESGEIALEIVYLN